MKNPKEEHVGSKEVSIQAKLRDMPQEVYPHSLTQGMAVTQKATNLSYIVYVELYESEAWC